jgi:uncharacterized LabA/DUF88 family protein
MLHPPDKLALFIDGANLHATAKALGFDIDYKRLLREFRSWGTLVRAYYYTTIIEDQESSSIRPLIDWLDYNGYTVVTKASKEFIDAVGRRKVKGNMNVELAVHALELSEHIDHLVLFSGDGDFRPLAEAVVAASGSQSSRRLPANHRCLRTSCAARPTTSSTSLSCSRSSAVIPPRATSTITRPSFCSARIRRPRYSAVKRPGDHQFLEVVTSATSTAPITRFGFVRVFKSRQNGFFNERRPDVPFGARTMSMNARSAAGGCLRL